MGATIIVLLLIALIPASIASKKGKSFGLWYVYGVCLWIVPVPFADRREKSRKELLPLCHFWRIIKKGDLLQGGRTCIRF